MNIVKPFVIVVAALALSLSIAQAQTLSPVASDDVPAHSFFYGLNNNFPPSPFDPFPDLTFYTDGTPGNYYYDLTDSDLQAFWTAHAESSRRMDEELPYPGEGGGGGTSYESNGFSYTFSTNGLWMQITGITNGIAYLSLNNATNYVYEVYSTEVLSSGLTNWNIETEVFPTNTSVMPFTVPVLDRTNSLYFYGRDWTGITSGTNQVPDWWFYYWFGTTAFSDTNLDSLGNTLLSDYQNGTDPNLIQFSLSVSNKYVANSSVAIQFSVTTGTPYFMTALVDDTNFADANWQPYNANFPVNIGSTPGWHQVWVGLRGLPSNATPAWDWYRFDLLTPPSLVITNPMITTVTQPMIEVQGGGASFFL